MSFKTISKSDLKNPGFWGKEINLKETSLVDEPDSPGSLIMLVKERIMSIRKIAKSLSGGDPKKEMLHYFALAGTQYNGNPENEEFLAVVKSSASEIQKLIDVESVKFAMAKINQGEGVSVDAVDSAIASVTAELADDKKEDDTVDEGANSDTDADEFKEDETTKEVVQKSASPDDIAALVLKSVQAATAPLMKKINALEKNHAAAEAAASLENSRLVIKSLNLPKGVDSDLHAEIFDGLEGEQRVRYVKELQKTKMSPREFDRISKASGSAQEVKKSTELVSLEKEMAGYVEVNKAAGMSEGKAFLRAQADHPELADKIFAERI